MISFESPARWSLHIIRLLWGWTRGEQGWGGVQGECCLLKQQSRQKRQWNSALDSVVVVCLLLLSKTGCAGQVRHKKVLSDTNLRVRRSNHVCSHSCSSVRLYVGTLLHWATVNANDSRVTPSSAHMWSSSDPKITKVKLKHHVKTFRTTVCNHRVALEEIPSLKWMCITSLWFRGNGYQPVLLFLRLTALLWQMREACYFLRW